MDFAGALEGRLLDLDDGVRAKAVTVLCDLAKNNFKSFPSTLISLIADRLRDKKVICQVTKYFSSAICTVFLHLTFSSEINVGICQNESIEEVA